MEPTGGTVVPMDAAASFAALVSGPPAELRLQLACSLMSAAFTGRDRSDEVGAGLDAVAGTVQDRTFEGVLAAMRPRLHGDRETYFDARNSFIDAVLERGQGLPITLSVIAIEVGRRIDVPIVGVGLPSHFMVKSAGADVYGDPFDDGALYSRAAVVSAWRRLVGEDHDFDELHLQPVGIRLILIRMLNNLRAIYAHGRDPRAMHSLAVMRGSFVELVHEAADHARWVRHYN